MQSISNPQDLVGCGLKSVQKISDALYSVGGKSEAETTVCMQMHLSAYINKGFLLWMNWRNCTRQTSHSIIAAVNPKHSGEKKKQGNKISFHISLCGHKCFKNSQVAILSYTAKLEYIFNLTCCKLVKKDKLLYLHYVFNLFFLLAP